jgi:hypothetical protein
MSLFCFFALVYTLNHTFLNETTDRQKYSKALIIRNKRNFNTLKLAELISRPIHQFQFYLTHAGKYFFRCGKISFFSVFFSQI